MKNYVTYICVLLMFICVSCNSDDDSNRLPQDRTLIFGWYGGNTCSGDCANIYKITTDKIYKDVDANFPIGDSFEGNFQELTNANYQDFVAVIDELPNQIFDEPNGFLQCSDCTIDLGGYYLEYSSGTIQKTWRFQNVRYPAYLENYRSMLLDKQADLNSL